MPISLFRENKCDVIRKPCQGETEGNLFFPQTQMNPFEEEEEEENKADIALISKQAHVVTSTY